MQEQTCNVHATLKGGIDKGGGAATGKPEPAAGSGQKAADSTRAAGHVILRLSATRKVDRDTRLVLLRGYIRSQRSSKLERIEVRMMVDTGAQGDFISPALVQKLGGTVEHGHFGIALEAF